ncbi:hypothetical protein [Streptomyces jumonjinensis]|uniref:hypothetical protein n=1 Tax=Streptomyces jumonjinensis TaxID=1945 RepID=UPI001E54865D|nr:hypothetical protein [Streptomyces jumonjinensis]
MAKTLDAPGEGAGWAVGVVVETWVDTALTQCGITQTTTWHERLGRRRRRLDHPSFGRLPRAGRPRSPRAGRLSGAPEPDAFKVADTVDKRSLLNPTQVAVLLAWIAGRPRTGHRPYAFFATLYYAGLRPEEAVALRVDAATLPAEGWGELLVHTTEPEVAAAGPTTAVTSRAVPRETPAPYPSTRRSSRSSAT